MITIKTNLGILKSTPTYLPARHLINSCLLSANFAALGIYMSTQNEMLGLSMLGTTSALSSLMGVTLTMAIGGKFYKFYKYLKSYIILNFNC